jgi:hypothetical protein
VTYLISAADRAAFKRCRRQWDFTAATRRNLQPKRSMTGDLQQAVRDALAVYYFPGMWDWDSTIVLPLVVKALDDSLARQRAAAADPSPHQDDVDWPALQERGRLLLERYFAWAPTVDRFSPVQVNTDFDAIVPHPVDSDRGLFGPEGGEVRYSGRNDLLAMDEHDRYWIVRHRLIDGRIPPTEQLLLDEESVAACWAWERFYDGMEVSGTIFNELAVTGSGTGSTPAQVPVTDHPRGGIPHNEPSGGGRGVSSPRRMYVKGRAAETTERMRQIEGDGFRRTVIRRGPAEVRAAGLWLAQEALDMVSANSHVYPNPAADHCSICAYMAPCLALNEGGDAEPVLAAAYRRRAPVGIEMGRLGGTPHGVGRGWVLGRGGQGPTPSTAE